jgi:hypothetical protein
MPSLKMDGVSLRSFSTLFSETLSFHASNKRTHQFTTFLVVNAGAFNEGMAFFSSFKSTDLDSRRCGIAFVTGLLRDTLFR